MTIGLLLIATGKYDVFLQPLIDSVENYFFDRYTEVEVFVFADKVPSIYHSKRLKITHIPIEHKPFPYPTLYRYKYFHNARNLIKTDYVFYCDVDMLFVDCVGKEILPDNSSGLVAVQHPGFAKTGGWGSPNTFKESLSYVAPEERGTYCAGGFQGGNTPAYLRVCNELDQLITIDENNGVIGEWHDESYWNRYLADIGYQQHEVKILSHEYCMSDADISGSPKLLALTKDHAALRS